MSVLGYIESGAQLGLQLLTIKPKRGFLDPTDGTFTVPDATLEEVHNDELEVTEHPVEQGTVIADHAFVRPAEVIITAAWSNSPNQTSILGALGGFAAAQSGAARALVGAVELASGVMNMLGSGWTPSKKAYMKLVDMYHNRYLFTIYTGKRQYRNMIIKSLSATTNAETENSVIVRIACRQILMVQTQTVTVPDSSVMSNPASTASPEDAGTTSPVPAPNINVTAIP
ncbi:phage baseplate protein [Caballeronia telluris]|uniref:Bacteriophage protein n=1 Tax=Caballeronia telluris TaxID=326475 RepID=A0A158G0R7_9BURK|nr:hypothetical protein [Caballeronia telluris]SAL25676.1 putative bacteriophage protein [Caballeronia telluris]